MLQLKLLTLAALVSTALAFTSQTEGAKPVVPLVKREPKKILLAFGKQRDKIVLHFPGCIRKPPHGNLLTFIGLILLLSLMYRWDHKQCKAAPK
jgi:hypothetical protein